MLKYCPDKHKYKTREMCDKAVDFCLITLKLVCDWFVTNKMLEKLNNSLFCNVDICFHEIYSNIIIFLSDDIGFNTIDINNINLDDDNFIDEN